MNQALWWHAIDDAIQCELCPHNCQLTESQIGYCGVRGVVDGKLKALTYGRPVAMHNDPIEKKPLYHLLPGSQSYSIGSLGCNLGCLFCQNWSLSKKSAGHLQTPYFAPEEIVRTALQNQCQSISFTYNEPLIWGEYVLDTAREAQLNGLITVLVSAGYATPSARAEIFEIADAANIDLKSYSEDFYQRLTGCHLEPVLATLKYLYHETTCWLEITNLIIPGENDHPDELKAMASWIAHELGPDVPLHFSAFHPNYRMSDRPATPAATLQLARNLAQSEGLHYVYLGNIPDPAGQTTYCPSCRKAVILRGWEVTCHLNGNKCAYCGTNIQGVFQ